MQVYAQQVLWPTVSPPSTSTCSLLLFRSSRSIMRQLYLILVALMTAIGAFCRRHHYNSTPAQPTADHAMQDKFEDIYKTNFWGSDEDGGGSGGGSTSVATQYTMSCIRAVINKFELTSMVDAPCGGMYWMPTLLRDIRDDYPDFRFLGIDIVRSVIQANQAKFVNESWMQFAVADFTQTSVQDNVQLILCRDALQHLPIDKAVDALEQFSRSKARFLLVGSYFSVGNTNRRINAGEYYEINLTLEPFSLTGYQHVYREHTQELLPYPEKHLVLYSISYLRGVDFSALRTKVGKFEP